jgi:hypothetical protein
MRSEAEIREVIQMVEESWKWHTKRGHEGNAYVASLVRSALLWVTGREDTAFAEAFIEPTRQRRRQAKAAGN